MHLNENKISKLALRNSLKRIRFILCYFCDLAKQIRNC